MTTGQVVRSGFIIYMKGYARMRHTKKWISLVIALTLMLTAAAPTITLAVLAAILIRKRRNGQE